MSGNKRRGIILQERDRHLLRELAVMRIIDRIQAMCVAGFGSVTRANARLLALVQAGLLIRLFTGTDAVGKKALYTLSPKGAALVDSPYRGLRRSPNEVIVANYFVNHQLKVNEIYCILKYGPIPIPQTRFVRWVSFSEPIYTGSALIPDGYAEVAAPGEFLAAFLEVDLGQETRKTWVEKVRQYVRLALRQTFPQQFGHDRFRVLAVTNSERRLESLRLATAEEIDTIFWFTTFGAIAQDGFWSAIWKTPKEDKSQALF
jgi:protein involved in plasmid replication-relaxation